MRTPDCHPDRPHEALGKCKPCYMADYYAANRERYRDLNRAWEGRNPGRSRLRRYGLTPVQFREMYDQQGGKCAICQEAPESGLVVDHDHSTGRVRALLCVRCNAGIGQFRERPEIMVAAIAYLAEQAEVAA